MNLQQLRYARALAECRSFVRAAEVCAVTQPTLSNGIAQLESELGHQLFTRTTRVLHLSEVGEQLLPDIMDILNAQSALVGHANALKHPERRMIRVGVSPVISIKFVDVVLEPFRSANPDVEIVFRELNLAEMINLLESGQLDFVFGPADAPRVKPSSSFDSCDFYAEPLIFVASSATRQTYGHSQSVSLDDIEKETFVLVPDACGLTRATRALFKKSRLKLTEYSGQAMSYGVLQEWAELGIGSAILPRSKVKSGSHREIPILNGTQAVTIHYCSFWKGGANTPQQVSQLATFLREAAPTIVKGLVR